MKGQLTPEQQLQVLARVWGNDRKGHVFLPYIPGWTKNKDERRKNFHEGRAFRWPRERDAILQHLANHAEDDLYFAPNLFDGKRRIEQNVAPEKVLYADLDPVDPGSLGQLQPTIAWESSPGHYQGVWVLDRERTGASWPGKENHRLTVAIEADPSGWDATQLLRVPGRPNYKFDYKDKNNGKPVEGQGLLWMDGPRYVWSDFDDLPDVGAVVGDDVEMIDEEIIDSVDRHEVWARVRLKVSAKCREYLALKTDPQGVADRDQVLWQIERDLADAGCTLIEIVAIVRPSVWNKYKGRNDELKRLKIEAAKAINARPDDLEESVEAKPNITWLKDVVAQPIPRPKWLVKDIWTRAGCGFIAGAPKSYKSWMGLDLALSVATGTAFLNQDQFRVSKPETVLYLQEEDSLALVMDRLANILESKAPERLYSGRICIAGGDAQRDMKVSVPPSARSGDVIWAPPVGDVPLALHVQTGFISSDPGWQAWLDEVMEEGKFALVIIDTLSTTIADTDMDKTSDLMSKVLKPLKQLANKHDAAICIIHHNKKAATDEKGRRAGNDMLGAVGLHAWVDCAIYARSKDSKGEIAIEREAKLAQEMTMRVQIPMMFWDQKTGERKLWDPELITEGLETVQEVREEPTPSKAGTGGQMLASKIKAMGGGPFDLETLAFRLGMSAGPLVKQLNAGVDNGFITQISDDEWQVPRS
jgi:hypothetical protein